MSYGIDEHKHNFAVWVAARAAQRGFTDVDTLRKALEGSGIREFLSQPSSRETGAGEFDCLHAQWCDRIVEYLKKANVSGATFGRAAKLVAVYLKAMVVVGGDHDSPLGRAAHPPVDRILLQNLARDPGVGGPHKRKWASKNWTQLDKKEYYELIAELKACLPSSSPLWAIEKYWTVTAADTE